MATVSWPGKLKLEKIKTPNWCDTAGKSSPRTRWGKHLEITVEYVGRWKKTQSSITCDVETCHMFILENYIFTSLCHELWHYTHNYTHCLPESTKEEEVDSEWIWGSKAKFKHFGSDHAKRKKKKKCFNTLVHFPQSL